MAKITWEEIILGGVYELQKYNSYGPYSSGNIVRAITFDEDSVIIRHIDKEYTENSYARPNELKRLKPEFKRGYLFPGDIIRNESSGLLAKVLEVGENSFVFGEWKSGDRLDIELDVRGPQIKEYNDVPKNWVLEFEEAKEMTLEEVCKKLGENIKITKE